MLSCICVVGQTNPIIVLLVISTRAIDMIDVTTGLTGIMVLVLETLIVHYIDCMHHQPFYHACAEFIVNAPNFR